MLQFYLVWYGMAALLFAAALWLTRGLAAPWRIVIATGVFAAGITTIPFASPDGGVWYPAGAFFFARSHWAEAAGSASLVIGVVWFFLAAVGLGVWGFFRTMRTPGVDDDDGDGDGDAKA